MAIRDASRALREGRHTSRKTGTVVEIGEDYDDKQQCRVEIKMPLKRRKKKPKGQKTEVAMPEPYHPRWLRQSLAE